MAWGSVSAKVSAKGMQFEFLSSQGGLCSRTFLSFFYLKVGIHDGYTLIMQCCLKLLWTCHRELVLGLFAFHRTPDPVPKETDECTKQVIMSCREFNHPSGVCLLLSAGFFKDDLLSLLEIDFPPNQIQRALVEQ